MTELKFTCAMRSMGVWVSAPTNDRTSERVFVRWCWWVRITVDDHPRYIHNGDHSYRSRTHKHRAIDKNRLRHTSGDVGCNSHTASFDCVKLTRTISLVDCDGVVWRPCAQCNEEVTCENMRCKASELTWIRSTQFISDYIILHSSSSSLLWSSSSSSSSGVCWMREAFYECTNAINWKICCLHRWLHCCCSSVRVFVVFVALPSTGDGCFSHSIRHRAPFMWICPDDEVKKWTRCFFFFRLTLASNKSFVCWFFPFVSYRRHQRASSASAAPSFLSLTCFLFDLFDS